MMPDRFVPGSGSLASLLLILTLVACGTPPTVPSAQVPESAAAPSSTPATEEKAGEGGDTTTVDDDDNIFFAAGATRVDVPGQGKLRVHAQRLKANPSQVIALVGRTDDVGSRSYNLAMAEQRIEAVVKVLRSYGVPKRQIHPVRRYSVGQGESEPACRTAICRQRMRRVELIYLPSSLPHRTMARPSVGVSE